MNINKKELDKYLLNIFIFLFIFNMVNREFKILIDFRIVNIFIGLSLIVKYVYDIFKGNKIIFLKKNENRKINNIYYLILGYYFIVFISNIRWFSSGLKIDSSILINLIMLNGYNFLAITIFYCYLNLIKKEFVVQSMAISSVFLFISMILVWIGVDICSITGEQFRTFSKGYSPIASMRIGGYAEDPNYASFSLLSMIFIAIKYIESKKYKLSIISICLIGYLLAFSKTLLIGFICIIIYLIVKEYMIKNKIEKYLYKSEAIVKILAYTIPIVIVAFNLIKFKSSTMYLRMDMWKSTLDLFIKSPIIGNGLGSVRSNFLESGGWFVQSHSIIFQSLSEVGVLGFLLLLIILIRISSGKVFNPIILLFMFFGLTSELMYLQFWGFNILIYLVFSNVNIGEIEYEKNCIYS